jgi:ornithine cyclodeaminase
LRSCGIISTATTSSVPVFSDDEIADGTHINGVGSFTPAMAEVPAKTVCRATVVVDQRAACLSEAGDLCQPMEKGMLGEQFHPAEIGEVISGAAVGRPSAHALTFFKSVGNAAQDIVCAAEVLRRAEEGGIGTMIVV